MGSENRAGDLAQRWFGAGGLFEALADFFESRHVLQAEGNLALLGGIEKSRPAPRGAQPPVPSAPLSCQERASSFASFARGSVACV